MRQAAADSLGQLGTVAADALPALIERLQDPRGNVRESSAQALGHIGSAGAELVQALSTCLEDLNDRVRKAAAAALGNLGPVAQPQGASALMQRLSASNEAVWMVRQAAAEALGKLGPGTAAVPLALEASLEDPHEAVRASSAASLGKLGGVAEAAIPALMRIGLQRSEAGAVRVAALDALGILAALGKLGSNSDAVTAAMHRAMESSCARVQKAASNVS
eukprot:TRINITY_DN56739_c0_g1_i1.p1 TRINITY_DN56739_c0_g1~~TRINITY_DN56739_c0_g1_i1.p1  ORF type:complete len:220 (+),score=43.97 TRINITY_DN56739_c0_g1_i1:259-918(+)